MKYKNHIKKNRGAAFYVLIATGSILSGLLLGVAMIYMNGAKLSFQNGVEIVKNKENVPMAATTTEPSIPPTTVPTLVPTTVPTMVPSEAPLQQATEVPVTEAPVDVPAVSTTPVEVTDGIKAVYLNKAVITDSKAFKKQLKLAKESNVNTMVFDVKDESGEVSFDLGIEEVKKYGALNEDAAEVSTYLKQAKENGIYTVARIVVFKDPILAKKVDSVALKNKSGKTIKDSKSEAWVNPYSNDVWLYELSIIQEAIRAGFDEVQLDYVRFNVDKTFGNAVYTDSTLSRTDLITAFVEEACNRVHSLGGKVSVNVYGTIFTSSSDAERFGQDVTKLATMIDYICPLLYPSSYANGSFGKSSPDLYPYEIVSGAYAKVTEALAKTQGSQVAIVRPWLQGFTASSLAKHQTYGTQQVAAQIQALKDNNCTTYGVWGASGNYESKWFE